MWNPWLVVNASNRSGLVGRQYRRCGQQEYSVLSYLVVRLTGQLTRLNSSRTGIRWEMGRMGSFPKVESPKDKAVVSLKDTVYG